MTELIKYSFVEVLQLLVTEYFAYVLGITIITGVIELFYLIMGIRRARR